MKILILSFYSGIVERGVETWAENLKEHIDSQFEITISGAAVGNKKFGSTESWPLKLFEFSRHFTKNFSLVRSADVVIPTNGSVQTFLARIFTWLLRKPMVVFGHAGLGADDRWNLFCFPDVFVAFSSPQAEWARKHKLPWTRVQVIPHAVDTKLFSSSLKKSKGNVVLCVAANIPSKRVGLVQKAVEKLPEYKFLAVGKGNKLEVKFSKMPQIYKKANIFCFVPRPEEAFGLVYLEAMASNLPVVTIDDPIRREIVGNAGVFVKHPENSNVLAVAIKKANKINWKKKPRLQAEKFSWDSVAYKYEKMFLEIR